MPQLNENALVACLQPSAGGRWYWCVKYLFGVTYESGVTDTPEHASELALLALKLLTPPKQEKINRKSTPTPDPT